MPDVLQQILYFFGVGLCHQNPERSLESGGLYFSVCARDTGIYLGLILTLLVLVILYTRTASKPAALPPAWAVAVSIVLIVPMAVDGVSSYAGLRESTNLLRYITGYLCGAGVAVLASGGLFSLWRSTNHEVSALDKPSRLSTVLVATCALAAVFYGVYPFLGAASALIAFMCQWLAVTFINLLILSGTRFWQPSTGIRQRVLCTLICVLATGVELAILSLIASGLNLVLPW